MTKIKSSQATAQEIERTMSKLAAAADCMWPSSSEDHKNVLRILSIISELRVCAGLIHSEDRDSRVRGYDRWDDVLTNNSDSI